MKIPKNQVLEKTRPVLFSLGLIIALSCTFIAFEWRSYDQKQLDIWIPIDNYLDTVIPPPIVPQILKKASAMPRVKIEQPTAFKITENVWEELFEKENSKTTEKDVPNDFDIEFIDIDDDTEDHVVEYDFQVPMTNPSEYAYLSSCESENHNATKFGCTKQNIHKYVLEHFKVNTDVFEQHDIRVSFVIDTTGRVTNIKTSGSSNRILINEAIRVVQSLPLFVPAKNNGRKHPMITEIPIKVVTN